MSNKAKYIKKSRLKVVSNLKGRIAEALIEELFLEMGYEVHRFGIENTIPGIADRLAPKSGDAARTIRKMPDFAVVDKQNEVFLIEVKYRSDGEFRLQRDYPYPEAIFILLRPGAILAQWAKNLMRGVNFTYLNSFDSIFRDTRLIGKYNEIAERMFSAIEDEFGL